MKHSEDSIGQLSNAPQGAQNESKEEYFERQERAHDFENNGYILTRPQLKPVALYGVLTYIVEEACRNSEAVPSSVAVNVLARFAATIGRTAHLLIGDQERYLNFNALIVGPTSKGRKGTSADMPAKLFKLVDRKGQWARLPELTALSTGEGLIHQVRDERWSDDEPPKRIDKGVTDKRLLCEVSEFASVLAVAARKEATISMVLRDAFDGKDLTTPTKTSFNEATGPHIVVVGSITEGELVKMLSKTDIVNGLANRFLMSYAARTKLVPDPQPTPADRMEWFANWIVGAVTLAVSQHLRPLQMTDDAKEYWDTMYRTLNEATHEPVIASLIAREELYVRVLATLLALLNQETVITETHLDAALAWRQYWEDTLNFIFSTSKKNENAKAMQELKDRIVDTIATLGGKNIRHAAITKKLTNNYAKNSPFNKEVIQVALEALQRESPPRIVAEMVTTDGPGRPANVYTLAGLKT